MYNFDEIIDRKATQARKRSSLTRMMSLSACGWQTWNLVLPRKSWMS